MAITFLQEPKQVSLAGNPVVYKLQSNGMMQANGRKAIHIMELTAVPPASETWKMTWLNGSVDLDFITINGVADNSGTQIPSGSGILSFYIDTVFIPALLNNYYLDRDFSIYRSFGNTVFFEAKQEGTEYNISFTSGAHSWNNGFVQTQSGINPVPKPNFRLLLQLFFKMKAAADYHHIQLERVPVGNISVFDLSQVLSTLNQLILPSPDVNTPQNVSDQRIDYYIKVAEAYGDSLQVQKQTSKQVLYALHGGLSQRDFTAINFNDDILPNFLTYRKRQKVGLQQPVFLTYFNNAVDTAFNLKVEILAGGTSIHTATLFAFNCNQYDQKLLPCSYALATDGVDLGGNLVHEYRLWVERQSDDVGVSDVVSFEPDLQKPVDEIILAYQNGLCALETYRFTGTNSLFSSNKHEQSSRVSAHDTAYQDRGEVVFDKSSQHSFQLHSGFLDKDESYLFQDLLQSKKVYLIKALKYLPVTIQAEKHQVKQTSSGRLNSYQITISLIPEKHFSHVGDSL